MVMRPFALEQHLALHGSPKVIAAYTNLRRVAGQEGKPGDESRELLKKLVLEMRKYRTDKSDSS
jgi:hypothetical protein